MVLDFHLKETLTVSIFQVCIKLNSKPSYVRLPEGNKQVYQDYGPDSLEDWHKNNVLEEFPVSRDI